MNMWVNNGCSGVAMAVVAGGFGCIQRPTGDQAAQNTALTQSLLLQLTASTVAVSWLLLRLLLDEQVGSGLCFCKARAVQGLLRHSCLFPVQCDLHAMTCLRGAM
jgi:hypothetical protein